MQIFSEQKIRNKISVLKQIPVNIEYIPNKKSIANFKDGTNCSISCLNCKNPLCMKYLESEISFEKVPTFSSDTNNYVCPVNAIKWNSKTESPEIEQDKCIKCGLCMKRCPVGAIYCDDSVKVNTEKSSIQEIVIPDDTKELLQKEQIEEMYNIPRIGTLFIETEDLLNEIYEKLSNIRHEAHNIIVRNILLGLGCSCAIRRIGDVYTRMDAIYNSGTNSIGAMEIEFGKDTLDASRGILDDIAVLNTRYNIPKEQNNPLVVCLQLPNARQGYWQVVKDIKVVENIKINTISIGALLILLWNNKNLNLCTNPFYADFDNMSIKKCVEDILGRKIQLIDGSIGIFEPIK